MNAVAVGGTVEDARGARYEVLREFPAGGQGEVFLVRGRDGTRSVAKRYHPHVATRDAARRLDALVAFDLSARSAAIAAPTVRLAKKSGLGALMPFVEGESLDDVLSMSRLGLVEGLGIGAVLGRAFASLETMGIAPGDIAASNVIVRRRADYFEATAIDFDNAVVPGAPPPAFEGQELYLAPEILAGRSRPTIESDRFAFAVLLHELLLQRYPFLEISNLASRADIVRAMQTVSWPDDPHTGKGPPAAAGGPPVGVLPRALQDLFRRALQPDPKRRPTMAEWARACEDALAEIYECRCGGMFINEPTRFNCLWCGEKARPYVLDLGGRSIPLVATVTVVGRDNLGGSLLLSRKHALFERRGFGLRVKNWSANRTAVERHGRWTELSVGGWADVSTGDRIRFADGIEGRVAIISP